MFNPALIQARSWIDVTSLAITTLGPAIITVLVTWMAFRSHARLKDKEIKAQAELKARELQFAAYQGSMDRNEKEAVEIAKVLGPLNLAFQLAADSDEKLKIRVLLLQQMETILTPFRGLSLAGFETELTKAGLGDTYRAHLSFINRYINMDFGRVADDQFGDALRNRNDVAQPYRCGQTSAAPKAT